MFINIFTGILIASCLALVAGADEEFNYGQNLYHRRYRVEGDIDLGSLKLLKQATDMKTASTVILKFIGSREAFDRELQLLRLLRSDYVVEVIDYFEVCLLTNFCNLSH
jgi:serine/threonine protein kinase